MKKPHYFLALGISLQLKEAVHQYALRNFKENQFQRWVNPLDYHLTYHFFGYLSDDKRKIIEKPISELTDQFAPFVVKFNQIGTFGAPEKPRILWLGCKQKSTQLIKQHTKTMAVIDQLGFDVDTRPFSPHMTLARKWLGDSCFKLHSLEPFFMKESFSELVLFRTHMNRAQKYERVARFPFGKGPIFV